jgi:hypothetical protein
MNCSDCMPLCVPVTRAHIHLIHERLHYMVHTVHDTAETLAPWHTNTHAHTGHTLRTLVVL